MHELAVKTIRDRESASLRGIFVAISPLHRKEVSTLSEKFLYTEKFSHTENFSVYQKFFRVTLRHRRAMHAMRSVMHVDRKSTSLPTPDMYAKSFQSK